MANKIPEGNIKTGNTIEAQDILNITNALRGESNNDIAITGSLSVTGSTNFGAIGDTHEYIGDVSILGNLSVTGTGPGSNWTSSADGSISRNSDVKITGSLSVTGDINGTNITALSSSVESRLTTNEDNITNLQTDSGSFSTRVTTNEGDIFDLQTDSGSFSTRVTTNETDITNLQTDSASFEGRITTNAGDISTNLSDYTTDSGSVSTRVTSLEASTGLWTGSADYISRESDIQVTGSVRVSANLELGGYEVNDISDDTTMAASSTTKLPTQHAAKTYIDNQVIVATSGSIFGTGSENYIARWNSSASLGLSIMYDDASGIGIGTTTPAEQLHVWGNVSASNYYGSGSELIGIATADDSASFSIRVSTNEIDIGNLQTDSGSFSTRITTNETDITTLQSDVTNLQTDSGSFSTRVTTNEVDITTNAGDITDLQTDSASFEGRITTNASDITTNLSDYQIDSGSFSTRVTTNEGDILTNQTDIGNLQLSVGDIENVTGSYATTSSNTFIGNQIVTGSVEISASLSIDGDAVATTVTNDSRYYQQSTFINVSAGAPDAGKPIVLASNGKFDNTMIPAGASDITVINFPVPLGSWDAKNVKQLDENIHGGVVKLVDNDQISNGTPINFTTGIGKFFLVVNAGTDLLGAITVTGDQVNRNTGEVTIGATEILTLDSLSVDNSFIDGNGNVVYDFSGSYITSKWYKGDIALTTTNVDLSDVDIWHCSFEQFNDFPSFTIETFDANVYANNAAAWVNLYAYSVQVANGKVAVSTMATMSLDATDVDANRYYRLRRGSIGKELSGTSDGVFIDANLGPGAQEYWEDITIKLWGNVQQEVSAYLTGSDIALVTTNFDKILSPSDTTLAAAMETLDEHLHDANYVSKSVYSVDSSSFSTRITTNEGDISDLQTDSGSFSTRVTTNETGIADLVIDSGSFSTRVTTLEDTPGGLWTGSDGYISRESDVQITGSLTVIGDNLQLDLKILEGTVLNYVSMSYFGSDQVGRLDYYISNGGTLQYRQHFTHSADLLVTESIDRISDSANQTIIYTYSASAVISKEYI